MGNVVFQVSGCIVVAKSHAGVLVKGVQICGMLETLTGLQARHKFFGLCTGQAWAPSRIKSPGQLGPGCVWFTRVYIMLGQSCLPTRPAPGFQYLPETRLEVGAV